MSGRHVKHAFNTAQNKVGLQQGKEKMVPTIKIKRLLSSEGLIGVKEEKVVGLPKPLVGKAAN